MDKRILDCGELLISKKLTIAFAESATAGYLSAKFSLVPSAGQFLKGGLACYDADLKKSLLNVPEDLIEKYTPESEEVTSAMSRGLMDLIPADIHVSVTGLTCEGGSENEEKPVGTMFINGLLQGKEIFAVKKCYQGDEEEIVRQTAQEIAELIIKGIPR
ncbi:MAG: nicotinamide-nucleotide amidohydrolase family protein [Pedobacter sp.]